MTPDPTPPSRAFVLGLADSAGHLDAGPLFDLGTSVGLTTTSIRLAIRRLAEAGLVTTEGRGRTSTIALTEAGLAQRAPDLAWASLAYRLDRRPDPWDQRWHLVSFSVPESQRHDRDRLRDYLVELVGAPLAGGLYVSHYDWRPWVHGATRRDGIAGHVTTASTTDLEVAGERDPRTIARALWALADLDAALRAFISRWTPALHDPPTDLGRAAGTVFAMSQEFEQLTRRDPLLPLELRPDDWRGTEVRRLYGDLLARLSAAHPLIGDANIFSAYLQAIDSAETMDDATFNAWFWNETRPNR